MTVPFKVKRGIYVDMDCTAILQVGEGIFIPTECFASDDNQKFQEDLSVFLKKWFCPLKKG